MCQPSLCCFGCDSALGPVFLLLEESSDGDSGASEVDMGSELSDGSDGEDEEGSLEDGSGENASVRAASFCLLLLWWDSVLNVLSEVVALSTLANEGCEQWGDRLLCAAGLVCRSL